MTKTITQVISGQADIKPNSTDELMASMLGAIRKHLDMEVAFLSEFKEGRRFFRHIDSDDPDPPIKLNGSDPLEESYCQRVVDGRLPELIHDASLIPAAQVLPVTNALPVGAHMSVPIVLRDGQIHGTFCCFSYTPDETLHERDLGLMRTFADVAAERIDQDLEIKRSKQEVSDRVNAVLTNDLLWMVYQPIYRLEDHKIVGFESLARFCTDPMRPPNVWFDDAASVDMSITLELKAIALAVHALEQLPSDVYIAVNISPEVILNGNLDRIFDGWPLERILLEVTEHAVIEYYDDITDKLRALRKRGLQIAVDDAGAGYSSFRHILNLEPDVIKLDQSITRNIDTSRSRHALASAFMGFARNTAAKIVAEGVETESELSTLQKLGVNKAQGYLLGKPAGIDVALKLFHNKQRLQNAHN